jgi:hypothetical protein
VGTVESEFTPDTLLDLYMSDCEHHPGKICRILSKTKPPKRPPEEIKPKKTPSEKPKRVYKKRVTPDGSPTLGSG